MEKGREEKVKTLNDKDRDNTVRKKKKVEQEKKEIRKKLEGKGNGQR